MTTNEVAKGYGVASNTIRSHKANAKIGRRAIRYIMGTVAENRRW